MMRLMPLLLLICAISTPSQALLVDAEPGNDELETTPVALDGDVDHDSDSGVLALVPGDVDLYKLTSLTVGEIVTVATAPFEGTEFEVPATILGLLDSAGELVALGTLPAQNQDLPEGETLRGASSLLRFRIAADGDYFVLVGGASEGEGGFADHEQNGRYVLSIHVTDPVTAPPSSDDEPANDTIATAALDVDATPAFTHSSGILELPVDDIDYVGVTGVLAGDAIETLTTPLVQEEETDPFELFQPDTRLGIFSADGTLLGQNDDSANDDTTGGGGSLLRLRAPADGDYYIAVTASADVDFSGVHGDPKFPYGIGTYMLSIDVVPQDPASRPPAVSIFADPPALPTGGGSSKISWSSLAASFCNAVQRPWTPSTATSGSQVVAPVITTPYTLECTGPGGKTQRTVTIAVVPPPTASLVADPNTIIEGGSSTLTWSSTDADFCVPVGETWTESSATEGSAAASPSISTTYTIECVGVGGSVQASTTLTVAPVPTAALTAMPAVIALGQSSLLTWTSSGSSSCSPIGEAWTTSTASAGQQSVSPQQTTTFTIECSGVGGAVQSSSTVTVVPPPQISLTAIPGVILLGDSTLLSWQASHADSCAPVGEAWTASNATAGSETLSPIQTTVFTIQCTGLAGTTQAQATVTVHFVPTVSLSATPELISAGSSTRLRWSSTHASSCAPVGEDWTEQRGAEGNETLTPAQSTTYTLECSGPGGTARSSATVQVNPAPTLSLEAEPASIEFGGSSTLRWTATNSTACGPLQKPWTTSTETSGSEVVEPLVTTTYHLVCGDALATVQASVTVEVVGSPTVSLEADPPILEPGGTATLRWTSTNATNCEPVGELWTEKSSTSGSEPVSPSETTTYTLACSGEISTAQTSVTVQIAPPPTLSLEADPEQITIGGESTLSWLSTDATGCEPVGDAWTDATEVSGSKKVSPTETTTYTLECSGPLRSVQASATVTVPEPALVTAQLAALGGLVALRRRRRLGASSHSD